MSHDLPVMVVTGAAGFVGWHLRCGLQAAGYETQPLTRAEPWVVAEPDRPSILFHCAGTNRGADEDVRDGNIEAAERAAELVKSSPGLTVVIYVNSTHETALGAYGESKRSAAELLERACHQAGVRFVNVVVPGVFGEWGRPYYNSFVPTFCDRIINGTLPEVTNDREVELVHVADLVDQLLGFALGSVNGKTYVPGHELRIGYVKDRLVDLHSTYLSGIVPSLDDPIERSLFNTLRSFWYPALYPLKIEPRSDNRGHLIETVKVQSGGQSFVSWTHPGITRGNHFHRRKFERFLVLSGEAEISLRRLFHPEVVTFRVTGERPAPIDMPTLHTHNITNVGSSELITMFWTNEIFDLEHPDTYAEQVGKPA